MLRRHHYERAFEEYLRARRVPYVAVDEARKALLPHGMNWGERPAGQGGRAGTADDSLKSFDFVLYGEHTNMLVDIKGRRIPGGPETPLRAGRLESWVTEDDVTCLRRWQALFGPGFEAAFVFVYWCTAQPPDALFQEVFEHKGDWYAVRTVGVETYAAAMKPRSPKWRTVYVPSRTFERISQPLLHAADGGLSSDSLFGRSRVERADPAGHPAFRPLAPVAGGPV